jgi:hypothetical protein
LAGGALKGKIGKSKFTKDRKDKIYIALAAGLDVRASSAAAGIDNATYWRWHKRGESAPEGSAYREFYLNCEAAIAAFSDSNLEFIRQARSDEWRAAAWLQEHRFPNEWGSSRVALPGEQQISIELVLTDGRPALPSSTVEVVDAEGDSPADTA